MTITLAGVFWWLVVFAFISVIYDLHTYEDRQTQWEREHPGAVYIRHYKRLERQSKRARRLRGEL